MYAISFYKASGFYCCLASAFIFAIIIVIGLIILATDNSEKDTLVNAKILNTVSGKLNLLYNF